MLHEAEAKQIAGQFDGRRAAGYLGAMASAGEQARAWLRGTGRRAARDRLRDVRLLPRRWVPASRRARPSFLVIGAQKSGTTSLFDQLARHPDVRAPLWKEPRFFDRAYYKGLGWYLSHFPERDGGAWQTGEATTGYLFHPRAAARVRATLPGVKVVAVLRNPIDRAVSHHAHERRKGSETRPIAEAFAADPRVVPAEERRMLADPTFESRRHRSESYLSRGVYAPQLARYLTHLGRERVLVLEFARLFAEPAASLRGLTDFLGLSPLEGVDLPKLNVGRYDRDAGFDREALRRFFAPHNEALSELLGRDFTGWR